MSTINKLRNNYKTQKMKKKTMMKKKKNVTKKAKLIKLK
jgi:hypothetical protein